MKKCIIILCLLISLPCSAADYYIAQSLAGSGDASSCANAKALSYLTGSWSGKVAAGDTVHLCGTLTSTLTIGGSGTSGHPITVIFESGAKFSKAAWGTDSSSAIYASGKSYIAIDGGTNGIIECTDNGSPNTTSPAGTFGTQQDAHGINMAGGTDIEIKNLTVRNIYQRVADSDDPNGYGRGIAVSNNNNVNIHHNTINNAYYGITAYASSANKDSLNIYNNDVTKVSTGVVVALAGAVNYSNIYIYNNNLHDFATWDGCWSGCTVWQHNDGIHTWGNYSGNTLGPIYIYSNTIGGDMGGHTSGWIYLSDYTTPAYIYNNVLYTTAEAPALGFIALHSYKASAVANIYNNTIVGAGSTNTGGTGVYLTNTGVWATDIKNNIMTNCYGGIYDTQGTSTITSDYNDFYNLGATSVVGSTWYSTLSAWQTFLGGCPNSDNDCNSITTNPLLDSNYAIPSNSPARDTGTSLSAYFTTDKAGTARPQGSAWDMGMYEYVNSASKAILTFDFNGLSPVVTGTVTEGSHTVALTVPYGTNVTALVPTITISGASVSPNTGVAANFTNPVTYTVTATDTTTQEYVVTVTVAAAPTYYMKWVTH